MPFDRSAQDLSTCKTCAWWDGVRDKYWDGICRANPPLVSETGTLWPRTRPADWCRLHEQVR